MRFFNHIRGYAIWLSLIFAMGIFSATSASHAITQIIVYQEPATNNKTAGLADVAADAFKSRLNRMNFMVLDTATVSRKVGISTIGASRDEVLARLSSIRSNYGDVLIIFLQSRLHLPASRNAYLQSNATVVSSVTESQIVSSSVVKASYFRMIVIWIALKFLALERHGKLLKPWLCASVNY